MLLNSQSGNPLEFTQGDNEVVLPLIATDDQGNPQNLTGFTLVTSIQGPNGVGVVTFPNSQHTQGNQTSAPGTFTLTLANAGADTASCGEGSGKEVITTATNSVSGAVINFRGVNLLTVYNPAPIQ